MYGIEGQAAPGLCSCGPGPGSSRRSVTATLRFALHRGSCQALRKALKMFRNTTFLRVALLLTLISGLVPEAVMAGLPLCCVKQQCSCESPVCARPNDYCSKWFPCWTSPLGCRRCNDYCSKGIPCIPCLSQAHRCNDYCRKCAPRLCPIRMICPGCASSCSDGKGCGSPGSSCSQQ